MVDQVRKAASHPYATGGGGVSLEQIFGAWALSSLLLGDPFPGLGEDQSVVRVRFQAGESSAVDDFVLFGEPLASGADGSRISIGVRRDPTIASSDKDFVALLGKYLKILRTNPVEVGSGKWRLGLAVASPHGPAQETATLADLARAHATEVTFREVVHRHGAKYHQRLGWLDAAVAAAGHLLEPNRSSAESKADTWQFLRALRVIETRLEGDTAADRTNAVARLRTVAADEDGAGVFTQLIDLASTYAKKGGEVDGALLRRDLVGKIEIARSPARRRGWELLDSLDRSLRGRVRRELADASGVRLELPRPQEKRRLVSFLRDVGKSGTLALVSGEPDVGKSTLVAAAVEELRAERATILHVSLLDIPDSIPTFEHALGTSLSNILAGAAVASSRLLIIDGAEAILHGRDRTLSYVASAAVHSGLGVVAVARDDAREQLTRLLSHLGTAGSGSRADLRDVSVPPLADEDVDVVVKAFPQLQRVNIEPRSRWLLGRPGLLDALLQNSVAAAPWDGVVSEVDVLKAVWRRVRRDEAHPPGTASPDAREAALLALARRQLDPSSDSVPDHSALSSLRSDGFLVAFGADGVFREDDQFIHDLIRDLALVRLFLKTPRENLLATRGAPRWALRAARIYCQARLQGNTRSPDEERQLLDGEFSALAKEHGERWSDVPWEACLLLGRGLKDAADVLLKEEGTNLAHVLRLIRQRFMDGGTANAAIVAPVVEFMCDNRDRISKLPENVIDTTERVVVGWLAALASRGQADLSDPLRIRVRDELINASSEYLSEFALQCLALLGPDLDQKAEAALLAAAKAYPHHIYHCLENTYGAIALAFHRPDLLVTLSLTYYLDVPAPDAHPWGRQRLPLDDGVREHHTGGWGPLASASYGPFLALLYADPLRGIALICKLLNHAARYRVASDVQDPAEVPLEDLRGIEIDIPGLGTRRYVGDEHVWRWYRGSGVGPAPCISALLALERWADGAILHKQPLRAVVRFLLRNCENLAIPGLVVGLLVRHIESVGDELDPWLVHPLVWRLEFERSTGDHVPNLAVVPKDGDQVVGSDRRVWSLRDVSMYLVASALIRNNVGRLEQLAACAATLEANAARIIEGRQNWSILERDGASEADDALLTVKGWAAALRQDSYTLLEVDGQQAVRFEVPKAVSEARAADRIDHERGFEGWRLLNSYDSRKASEWVRTIEDDIRIAKGLQRTVLASGPDDQLAAPAAVAAAALELHSSGLWMCSEENRRWAARTLIDTAREKLREEPAWSASSFFPYGSDRIAARGLASAYLMLRSLGDTEQKSEAIECLVALLDGPVAEVRRVAAVACVRLWNAPCDVGMSAGDGCFHRKVLAEATRIAMRCRMGPFDQARNAPEIISVAQPFEEKLRTVETRELVLGRLTSPLLAFMGCTASSCCVSGDAIRLRDALSEAYLRVRVRYADEGYRVQDADDQAVAEYLLYESNKDLVPNFVSTLAGSALALKGFLRDLATVATYDPARRRIFRDVWPTVMEMALAHVPKRHDAKYEDWVRFSAACAIIPRPTPRMNERDIDAVLAGAAQGWPSVAELSERIRRWVDVAIGEPECTNALTGFLQTAPLEEQAGRGLTWVSERVTRALSQFVGQSAVLLEWLDKMGASGRLDSHGLRVVRTIVDGLVAAGDRRAVQVQARAE